MEYPYKLAKQYRYEGPVKMFGLCIDLKWIGETFATSKKKAKQNMKIQYNIDHGYGFSTDIRLPGKIIKI